ncbi:hypothetical protein AVEN_244477-1 [Araneus ventricosus]|uniref:Uncharacterized protein n=1 Tax=Araneus ventricosus TaxID=182803 RepID=A0A4Y2L2L7_ARAVE|nr:hypothetical protein AVEN_244477-1 [Araneus ventricosus]
MGPKKVSGKVSAQKKMMSIELKREIIEKNDDERDVNELVEEHSQELTTEELQELQSQQHSGVLQEIGFEEYPEVEYTISTSEIKEILGIWERVSQFVEKKHPEKVATGRASELFKDTCLTHFRSILQGRKKQTFLDSFF